MLIVVNHLIFITKKITFQYWVKEILLELMENLVLQKKSLVLILVKQGQNFVYISITMVIIVICLSMEKKFVRLKLTMVMLIFYLNFVEEAYLMNLAILR